MAALESPFDGLLSCSSVFVRPNPNMASGRYGEQHADDQYSHIKGADSYEGGGGHDLGDDPAWRWGGPTDTGDRADDLLVDPESQPSYSTAGKPRQHQQSHSAGAQGGGSSSSPERLNVGYGSGDSHFEGEEERSWVRGASEGGLTDADDAVVQHGAPSPVVGAMAASPPSALRSFEDQPIRGLARVKEMSLDELIAQGERQMQESQAKTALAKPPIPPSAAAAGGGGVVFSRPNSPPGANPSPAAVDHQGFTGFDKGEGNTERDGSNTAFVNGGGSSNSSSSSRPMASPAVRPSSEMPGGHAGGASASQRGDGNTNNTNNTSMRSSAASHLAWGDRNGSGTGSGLRTSLRSGASFATSWSGGDPEQLRHLSMGVMPAAAGTGDEGGEMETREEREQREFHELEMELLREEERGAGRGEGAVEAQHERYHADDDDGWDQDKYGISYAFEAGGDGNGEVRRDGLEGRNLGWEHHTRGSDNANQAAAGRYRAFTENVGVETAGIEGGHGPSSPRSNARLGGTGDAALGVSGPSGDIPRSDGEGESARREDEQALIGGGQQPDYDERNKREGREGDEKEEVRRGRSVSGTEFWRSTEDDDDTRRWEAEENEGGHGHVWPVSEGGEWGRTAVRGGGNIRRASQDAQQQQQQQQDRLSLGNGADGPETAFARHGHQPPRTVHTPPPPPPLGAPAATGNPGKDDPRKYGSSGGSSNSNADVRGRKGENQSDPFGDNEAWGDVNTVAGAGPSAPALLRGTAPVRNRSVGQHQEFPNGAGVGGNGVPQSRKPPLGESAPFPAATAAAEGPPKRGPSQSKLVQRVFGGRGRRGGGRSGGRGRSRLQAGTGRGRGKQGIGQAGAEEEESQESGDGGGAGGSWAVQAELQGKLRELEDEVARYKEENERARLARRKQETALAEVMRKRQEVREWAEAERAAVEAWCTEQRQASAREKRAAVKQVQGLRARALAGGGLGGGTATERRQRQEIEGLKATIERAKLDAETAKKKARASERRLQQQIKAGAERVAELEGQVSFLERQRVEVWASARGGSLGAPVGGGRAPKVGVASGLSRSMNGGSAGGPRHAVSGAARLTGGASGTGPAEEGRAVSDVGRRNTREAAAAWRSRWSAGCEAEDGDERGGRGGQGVFAAGIPTEVDDVGREDWGREASGGADARSHHETKIRFAEGGVTPVRRRQGVGERSVGNGDSSTPDKGKGDPAIPPDEDGPQRYARQPREAGGYGDVGYDGGWSEQEEVEVVEGGEDEGSVGGGRRIGFKSGGNSGGVPWRSDRGKSRRDRDGDDNGDGDDVYEAEPSLDGLRGASRERAEQRFRDGQHLGHHGNWHHPNVPVTSRCKEEGRVERQENGEVFVDGHAGFVGGLNGNVNTNGEINGTNDAARPPAASSDGVKYDPLRYEMAVAVATSSHTGAAGGGSGVMEGDEAGTWTGGYPNRTQAVGGMRRSSSDGRQSARAAAAAVAASLDRTSALRHSDGGGAARAAGAGSNRQQSGGVVVEGPGAGAPGGVHGGSGGGGGGGGAEPEGWRDPNDGREEQGTLGFADGGRGRPPERDLRQAADTKTVGVGDSPHQAGGHSNGREERAGVYTGDPGAMGEPDRPQVAAGAAGGGLSSSAGGTGKGNGARGGGKVEHVLRDGRRVILFANGTQKEMLPDGGCVVRFVNGDLKRVEGGSGVVVYTYAAARTTHTMHPSGLEVFEFPSGQVERHHKTGEKEIHFPDGTRKYILPSGREMSEFPDGVTVVEYPEGHRDVTSPNGTTHRERPDGTVETPPQAKVRPRGDGFMSREGDPGADDTGGSRIHPKLLAAVGGASRGGW